MNKMTNTKETTIAKANNAKKFIVKMKHFYRQRWIEKWVSLESIVEWTRTGKYVRRVNAARGLELVRTEIGLASGGAAEEWLPKVSPAIGLPGYRPSGENSRASDKGRYTGLVLLSLPVTTGQETMEQLRSIVNVWEQTLMSFIGARGETLEVLMRYELENGKLPQDPEQVALFQQYAYKRAAEFVRQSTGVSAKEVVHDGTETFRVSADPLVYYNPTAQAIRMSQPTEPLTSLSAQVVSQPKEVQINTQVLPGYTRREMDVLKFNTLCRNFSYRELCEMEEHLMRLAVECRKAGIDQELATKMALEALDCWDKESELRSTFQNAYNSHKLGMQNPIEPALMHQQLLEDFLKRRYMFRRNRVTGEVEYQEKYMYELWWKPLTQEARNDINNAAIREGIKVWPKDLERILISERINQYDPVREWLDALPRWDGRDRLGEMADRVKTASPGWRDNFKVWMRSMVSQWQSGANAMYGAQMVLMLVGGQGTRKSTFMRMLLPRELKPFYIDRIDFTNKKEALRALSRFLLINIDEYDQVSKAQTAFLKHLIQRTDVKERRLYSTTFEQQQRYAAFCATTNSLAPLKDESGSRRYLVVEVADTIDTDMQGDKAIDYQQLYAQIVYEIAHGEEYAFTGERERLIQEHNADYYEMPNVISLFEDRFRKPQQGDTVLLMSPTEILKELKMDAENRSNATLIGSYLRRKGFERGDGYNRRRYKIAPCF